MQIKQKPKLCSVKEFWIIRSLQAAQTHTILPKG